MPKDLRTFIGQVQDAYPENYFRVSRPVDPNLELTAVLRQLQDKDRFPMLMFEDVKNTDIPVLSNALGSRDRLALLFDSEAENISRAYEERQRNPIPPDVVRTGPVKDVIETGQAASLNTLPQITHCGPDAGPYIDSGIIIAKDPDTGIYNAGIFRSQIAGPQKLRVYLGEYSDMWHLHHKAEERGEPLEVAYCIGHYPTMHMASQYRGGLNVDEIEIAGGLAGEPIRMTQAETLDLLVPADAEIIVEGRMLPNVREEEGPFSEFTWTVGPAQMGQVVEVTAITRRKDAIYQDIFNAHPEHNLIGMVGREANLRARVESVVPTVKAVALPFSGTSRFTAYISIKKELDGQARTAALMALAQESLLKLAIIVDEDVNVFNEAEVMWAVATRVQADKDVVIIPECHVVELDPSAYDIRDRTQRGALNAKWFIDATKPVAIPFQPRADVPEEVWRNIRIEDYLG